MSKMLEKTKNFLIYLFLLLLPWQTRLIWRSGELNGGYWEYGTVSIYMTEVILWLAIISSVTRFVYTKNQESRIKNQGILEKIIPKTLPLTSYFLLLGLVALRPALHFYYLFRFAEGVGLYFLVRSVDLSKATRAFILGMAPQALLGIWQFLAQASFVSKWLGMALHDPSVLGTFVVEATSGRWLRAYGGMPHPNILGGYLIVAIVLLINSMSYKHSNKFQISPPQADRFQNLLFIIFVAALFFTFSRSAWLALFIGLLVYWFIVKEGRKAIIHNSLFIILVFVILGAIFSEPLLSRVQNQNRLEIKSQIERVSGYKEAWQIIRHHPLTGVGLGNYTYAVWKEIDFSRPSYAYQPVHNIFVLLLAEVGIIGTLLLFVFLFIAILKNSLLLTSCFLILFLGFFDHYLLTLYPGVMLLFLIVAIARSLYPQIYRS